MRTTKMLRALAGECSRHNIDPDYVTKKELIAEAYKLADDLEKFAKSSAAEIERILRSIKVQRRWS